MYDLDEHNFADFAAFLVALQALMATGQASISIYYEASNRDTVVQAASDGGFDYSAGRAPGGWIPATLTKQA